MSLRRTCFDCARLRSNCRGGFLRALPKRSGNRRRRADRPSVGGDREIHIARCVDGEEFDYVETGDYGEAGADGRYLAEEAGIQQRLASSIAIRIGATVGGTVATVRLK